MEASGNSGKGTRFKLNVNMTPIEGYSLADLEWEVHVFTEPKGKVLTVKKAQAKQVDNNNFIICVDSAICGAGLYYITLIVKIRDSDFSDGWRIEQKTICTGVNIATR
mgnify:CR=1 FL=1